MKLRRTAKGEYYIVLPRDLMRVVKWHEGEDVEAILGSETEAKKEDIILRRK
jgi:antitoxin component of MazEF toxin-antitoxin module